MSRLVVLKAGGEIVRATGQLGALAAELTRLHAAGDRAVVVHGGGPQANELSERLGFRAVQVDGRRVTDGAAREVAKMVFAGTLNTEIVAALQVRRVRAVGLSGIDGGVLAVERRAPTRVSDGDGVREVDFGFVGDVVGVNPALLRHLLAGGFVPVVCSLAADREGEILNVNADTVAAELAIALRAERLVLLTPSGGVYRNHAAHGECVPALTGDEARALLADGTATGGMRPKLAACVRAIEGGVGEAWIAALGTGAPGRLAAGTRIAAAAPRALDDIARASMFMRHDE